MFCYLLIRCLYGSLYEPRVYINWKCYTWVIAVLILKFGGRESFDQWNIKEVGYMPLHLQWYVKRFLILCSRAIRCPTLPASSPPKTTASHTTSVCNCACWSIVLIKPSLPSATINEEFLSRWISLISLPTRTEKV